MSNDTLVNAERISNQISRELKNCKTLLAGDKKVSKQVLTVTLAKIRGVQLKAEKCLSSLDREKDKEIFELLYKLNEGCKEVRRRLESLLK